MMLSAKQVRRTFRLERKKGCKRNHWADAALGARGRSRSNLTPCRFAAVPLGKADKVLVENGIYCASQVEAEAVRFYGRQGACWKWVYCAPYQGGQPRSDRGSGFEPLLPRAPRDRSGKALLGKFGIGNKGLRSW